MPSFTGFKIRGITFYNYLQSPGLKMNHVVVKRIINNPGYIFVNCEAVTHTQMEMYLGTLCFTGYFFESPERGIKHNNKSKQGYCRYQPSCLCKSCKEEQYPHQENQR